MVLFFPCLAGSFARYSLQKIDGNVELSSPRVQRRLCYKKLLVRVHECESEDTEGLGFM